MVNLYVSIKYIILSLPNIHNFFFQKNEIYAFVLTGGSNFYKDSIKLTLLILLLEFSNNLLFSIASKLGLL